MRALVERIRSWLDHHLNRVTPKSPTGKAPQYINGEWQGLVQFLKDGDIPLSSEAAENA